MLRCSFPSRFRMQGGTMFVNFKILSRSHRRSLSVEDAVVDPKIPVTLVPLDWLEQLRSPTTRLPTGYHREEAVFLDPDSIKTHTHGEQRSSSFSSSPPCNAVRAGPVVLYITGQPTPVVLTPYFVPVKEFNLCLENGEADIRLGMDAIEQSPLYAELRPGGLLYPKLPHASVVAAMQPVQDVLRGYGMKTSLAASPLVARPWTRLKYMFIDELQRGPKMTEFVGFNPRSGTQWRFSQHTKYFRGGVWRETIRRNEMNDGLHAHSSWQKSPQQAVPEISMNYISSFFLNYVQGAFLKQYGHFDTNTNIFSFNVEKVNAMLCGLQEASAPTTSSSSRPGAAGAPSSSRKADERTKHSTEHEASSSSGFTPFLEIIKAEIHAPEFLQLLAEMASKKKLILKGVVLVVDVHTKPSASSPFEEQPKEDANNNSNNTRKAESELEEAHEMPAVMPVAEVSPVSAAFLSLNQSRVDTAFASLLDESIAASGSSPSASLSNSPFFSNLADPARPKSEGTAWSALPSSTRTQAAPYTTAKGLLELAEKQLKGVHIGVERLHLTLRFPDEVDEHNPCHESSFPVVHMACQRGLECMVDDVHPVEDNIHFHAALHDLQCYVSAADGSAGTLEHLLLATTGLEKPLSMSLVKEEDSALSIHVSLQSLLTRLFELSSSAASTPLASKTAEPSLQTRTDIRAGGEQGGGPAVDVSVTTRGLWSAVLTPLHVALLSRMSRALTRTAGGPTQEEKKKDDNDLESTKNTSNRNSVAPHIAINISSLSLSLLTSTVSQEVQAVIAQAWRRALPLWFREALATSARQPEQQDDTTEREEGMPFFTPNKGQNTQTREDQWREEARIPLYEALASPHFSLVVEDVDLLLPCTRSMLEANEQPKHSQKHPKRHETLTNSARLPPFRFCAAKQAIARNLWTEKILGANVDLFVDKDPPQRHQLNEGDSPFLFFGARRFCVLELREVASRPLSPHPKHPDESKNIHPCSIFSLQQEPYAFFFAHHAPSSLVQEVAVVAVAPMLASLDVDTPLVLLKAFDVFQQTAQNPSESAVPTVRTSKNQKKRNTNEEETGKEKFEPLAPPSPSCCAANAPPVKQTKITCLVKQATVSLRVPLYFDLREDVSLSTGPQLRRLLARLSRLSHASFEEKVPGGSCLRREQVAFPADGRARFLPEQLECSLVNVQVTTTLRHAAPSPSSHMDEESWITEEEKTSGEAVPDLSTRVYWQSAELRLRGLDDLCNTGPEQEGRPCGAARCPLLTIDTPRKLEVSLYDVLQQPASFFYAAGHLPSEEKMKMTRNVLNVELDLSRIETGRLLTPDDALLGMYMVDCLIEGVQKFQSSLEELSKAEKWIVLNSNDESEDDDANTGQDKEPARVISWDDSSSSSSCDSPEEHDGGNKKEGRNDYDDDDGERGEQSQARVGQNNPTLNAKDKSRVAPSPFPWDALSVSSTLWRVRVSHVRLDLATPRLSVRGDCLGEPLVRCVPTAYMNIVDRTLLYHHMRVELLHFSCEGALGTLKESKGGDTHAVEQMVVRVGVRGARLSECISPQCKMPRGRNQKNRNPVNQEEEVVVLVRGGDHAKTSAGADEVCHIEVSSTTFVLEKPRSAVDAEKTNDTTPSEKTKKEVDVSVQATDVVLDHRPAYLGDNWLSSLLQFFSVDSSSSLSAAQESPLNKEEEKEKETDVRYSLEEREDAAGKFVRFDVRVRNLLCTYRPVGFAGGTCPLVGLHAPQLNINGYDTNRQACSTEEGQDPLLRVHVFLPDAIKLFVCADTRDVDELVAASLSSEELLSQALLCLGTVKTNHPSLPVVSVEEHDGAGSRRLELQGVDGPLSVTVQHLAVEAAMARDTVSLFLSILSHWSSSRDLFALWPPVNLVMRSGDCFGWLLEELQRRTAPMMCFYNARALQRRLFSLSSGGREEEGHSGTPASEGTGNEALRGCEDGQRSRSGAIPRTAYSSAPDFAPSGTSTASPSLSTYGVSSWRRAIHAAQGLDDDTEQVYQDRARALLTQGTWKPWSSYAAGLPQQYHPTLTNLPRESESRVQGLTRQSQTTASSAALFVPHPQSVESFVSWNSDGSDDLAEVSGKHIDRDEPDINHDHYTPRVQSAASSENSFSDLSDAAKPSIAEVPAWSIRNDWNGSEGDFDLAAALDQEPHFCSALRRRPPPSSSGRHADPALQGKSPPRTSTSSFISLSQLALTDEHYLHHVEVVVFPSVQVDLRVGDCEVALQVLGGEDGDGSSTAADVPHSSVMLLCQGIQAQVKTFPSLSEEDLWFRVGCASFAVKDRIQGSAVDHIVIATRRTAPVNSIARAAAASSTTTPSSRQMLEELRARHERQGQERARAVRGAHPWDVEVTGFLSSSKHQRGLVHQDGEAVDRVNADTNENAAQGSLSTVSKLCRGDSELSVVLRVAPLSVTWSGACVDFFLDFLSYSCESATQTESETPDENQKEEHSLGDAFVEDAPSIFFRRVVLLSTRILLSGGFEYNKGLRHSLEAKNKINTLRALPFISFVSIEKVALDFPTLTFDCARTLAEMVERAIYHKQLALLRFLIASLWCGLWPVSAAANMGRAVKDFVLIPFTSTMPLAALAAEQGVQLSDEAAQQLARDPRRDRYYGVPTSNQAGVLHHCVRVSAALLMKEIAGQSGMAYSLVSTALLNSSSYLYDQLLDPQLRLALGRAARGEDVVGAASSSRPLVARGRQARTLREGLAQGRAQLSAGVQEAAAIVRWSLSPTGRLHQLPVAAVRLMMGASGAATTAFWGLRNENDDGERQRDAVVYKGW